jgi:hypothetical protein
MPPQLNSPQLPLNHSTSINQQLQKSLTTINPNSNFSPAYFDDADCIIPISDQNNSNQMNIGFIKDSYSRIGRTLEDFDKGYTFNTYFPAFNIEWVARYLNIKAQEKQENMLRKHSSDAKRKDHVYAVVAA